MRFETLAALEGIFREVLAANDNAPAPARPVVRAPRRRPEATYAASDNVILPLAFAERMPGWKRMAAPAAGGAGHPGGL